MKYATTLLHAGNTVVGNDIPLFPEFRKITLDDKATIDSFVKIFLPYSDFSFTNLYSWRPNGNVSEISILNENLIVKAWNIISANPEVSIIGATKIKKSISQLLETFDSLSLVPNEITTDIENSDKYIIEEDPANNDYILSITDLVSLKGNKYKSKRNDVKRFCTRYANHTLKRLDSLDMDQITHEILSLYKVWLNSREIVGSNTELNAITNMLEVVKKYRHVIILGIYIENELRAFVVQEPSQHEYSLEGFAKANHSFKGISSYLMHISAKTLGDMGYKYINYEQDLGLENLRKQKLSWRPVRMFKKYKIKKNV